MRQGGSSIFQYCPEIGGCCDFQQYVPAARCGGNGPHICFLSALDGEGAY